jgi:pimeloyl-ACP methyl ester carboxylesterase
MKQLTLKQGVIQYRDEGSGPAVVFVHGLLASGELWAGVVERLQGYRCIVPDWPLGSHAIPMDAAADLSPAGVAELVADFLAALELRDVTLVGNDSGGAICQLVVTRHPERIGRLVLTNCDAFEIFPPPQFGYLKWLPRIPGAMWLLGKMMLAFPRLRRLSIAYGALTEKRLDDALLRAWVEPGARDGRIRRDTAKFIRGVDPAITLEAAEKLRGFDRPALLLWGANDPYFRLALAQRLAAQLPHARLLPIDGARTFVPLDRPDAVAAGIRS